MTQPQLLIVLLLLSLTSLRAGVGDSSASKRIKVLPVPSFGYSPETRTYIGAVALFTLRSANSEAERTSNAKLKFTYTWNRQVILECGWNYFLKNESWFTKGQIVYSQYPDLYYGIGTATPDSNRLNFNSNRFVLDMQALKKIGRKLFGGITAKYTDYSNIKYSDNSVYYPELKAGSQSGLGLALLKDSRNSLLTPASGVYAFLNTNYMFSASNYVETTIDLRCYKTWKNKYTFANRFVNYLNPGLPPFYGYAFLGGDKFVRGYYYGRYRDNCLSTLQSEFRFHVAWKIGLAAFGGLSLNYPSFAGANLTNSKYNYGMGLRFLVDKTERTNLRFDYAVGQDGNKGFYIAFGESF